MRLPFLSRFFSLIGPLFLTLAVLSVPATAQGSLPATLLSGSVNDSNHRVIAGAIVTVWSETTSDGLPPQSALLIKTESGPDGTWTAALPPGNRQSVIVTASAKDRAPASQSIYLTGTYSTPLNFTPAPLKLTLLPVKKINIRVVDWSNQPIGGAEVTFLFRRGFGATFSNAATNLGSDDTKIIAPVKTEKDGTVSLPFAAEGDDLSVQISAPGMQRIRVNLIVPEEDGVTIRLSPGCALKGRLVDVKGAPIPNCKLSLLGSTEQTQSRPDGSFSFEGLDAGPVWLLASGDLLAPPREFSLTRGTITEAGDVTLTPGCTVEGYVRSAPMPYGMSLPDFFVTLTRPSRAGQGIWEKEIHLDQDGHYSVRVPAGQFRLVYKASSAFFGPVVYDLRTSDGDRLRLDFGPTSAALAKVDSPPPAKSTTVAVDEPLDNWPPDYLYGKVVRPDGEMIPGAMVRLYQGDRFVRDGKANTEGKFALGPLTGDMGLAGNDLGLVKSGPGQKAPPLYLRANVPGFDSLPVLLNPGTESVTLTAGPLTDLHLKVVTTIGEPVSGAIVTAQDWKPLDRLVWGSANRPPALLPQTGPPLTDGNGEFTLPDLPPDGLVHLTIPRAGFQDRTLTVALPQSGVLPVKLFRPAVIETRIRFGTETLPIPASSLKMSGEPDCPDANQAAGANGDGSLDFHCTPSTPERTRQLDFYPDLADTSLQVAPGLVLSPERPDGRATFFLVDTRTVNPRRWLGTPLHAQAPMEGQTVHLDYVLKPLVLVRGQLFLNNPGKTSPQAQIFVHRPKSTGGFTEKPLQFQVEKGNDFEVWVPAGEATFLEVRPGVGASQSIGWFKPLPPYAEGETPTIELRQAPGAATAFAGRPMIRVIGPDGATLPRVAFQYRPADWPNAQFQTGYSDMDGRAYLNLNTLGPPPAFEVTSPLMENPIRLTPRAGEIETLPLNRLPVTLPGRDPNAEKSYSHSGEPMPAAASLGETAADLLVDKWLKGGPVSLLDLRGKVVVVLRDFSSVPPLLPRLEEPNPKVAVLVLSPKLEWDTDDYRPFLADTLPGVDEPLRKRCAAAVTAVGRDRPVMFSSLGYSLSCLGARYASVILSPEGRIVAHDLTGEEVAAKVEQLLYP